MWLTWAFGLVVAGLVSVLILVAIALAVAFPNLPEITDLSDYRPKLPLRVMSSEGQLLAEYGEELSGLVGWKVENLVARVDEFYIAASAPLEKFPGPQEWTHLALAWDETRGIRFFINGKLNIRQFCICRIYTCFHGSFTAFHIKNMRFFS